MKHYFGGLGIITVPDKRRDSWEAGLLPWACPSVDRWLPGGRICLPVALFCKSPCDGTLWRQQSIRRKMCGLSLAPTLTSSDLGILPAPPFPRVKWRYPILRAIGKGTEIRTDSGCTTHSDSYWMVVFHKHWTRTGLVPAEPSSFLSLIICPIEKGS